VHTRAHGKFTRELNGLARARGMNNSYELIRFARIGGNMNAYLKGMHRQKNIMSPHKLHQNSSLHNE
jgi:hypothetical protein